MVAILSVKQHNDENFGINLPLGLINRKNSHLKVTF